ncbi:MAG: 2-oxoacid:acceptor oxidoreductase family protein [Peptococcaceae bacterium]|jgi:2-oxoglutarate ferredoxin oxidoreductase subunit gamma|nr:2-oxoacid:acceptor oxidoreductase family protein [Peptococcaceae bacterium]
MEYRVLIAGFGGQGVLSTGELLAVAAMMEDKHVSWMPAYGPEMRGGAANCGVVIADTEIASPVVSEPGALLAMNGPSLDRFGPLVETGGLLIVNSSLTDPPPPNGVTVVGVPAQSLALELGKVQVAANIMLGVLVGYTGMVDLEAVEAALEKVFYKQKKLLPLNQSALRLGFETGLREAGRE